MKKFLLLALLAVAAYKFLPNSFTFLPTAGAFDKSGKPLVVVFVGPNCGGPCDAVVGTLKQRGVSFQAIDVVGADGAHSLVREALLGRRRQSRAIAIRGYAPTPPGILGRQVIRYGSRRQPSYAWAFDRGDGLANVGYGELLPGAGDARRPPSRRLLLDQLEELIPGVVATGGDWRGHHLPLSGWRWDQPDGPVLLVGDAAGLVNPMTGEGIYYAVATGIAAGRTAARCLAGGRPVEAGATHRHDVRRLLGTHLRHTWVASRLSQSPGIVDAGIRAAARDRHAFDTLVELGLGAGRIDARLAAGLVRSLVRPTRPLPSTHPSDPPAVRTQT